MDMPKILVLDDDNAILEYFREILSGEHEVTCLSNGEEGLEACEQACFDVVITDLFMPYKDGLEIIREVNQVCPGIKIIAITGESAGSTRHYLDLAKDLGAGEILRKPIDASQLRGAVSAVLGGTD